MTTDKNAGSITQIDEKINQAENDIAKIKKEWQIEQLSIASRVVIHADPLQSNLETETQSQSSSATYSHNSDYLFLPIKYINSSDQILGGVDVSFPSPASNFKPKDENDINNNDAIAVYVLHQNESVIHQNHLHFKLNSPYIPSYLAMRELHPIKLLIEMTEQKEGGEEQPKDGSKSNNDLILPTAKATAPIADVILVDGNGIMHERSAGIATCLGVSLDRKTIGIGKTLYCFDGLTKEGVKNGIERRLEEFLIFCREYNNNHGLGVDRGQKNIDCVVMCQNSINSGSDDYGDTLWTKNGDEGNILSDSMIELSKYCAGFAIPLQGKSGKIWGAALLGHGGKYNKGVGTSVPVYVSIGHDMSLQEAVQICARVSYTRIPEPVRQADLLGRQWMREQHISL